MEKNLQLLKSVYLKELIAYLCWFRKVSKERGNDNPLSWDSYNYNQYLKRDGELLGMEKLLQFSEEEKKRLFSEAEVYVGPPDKEQLLK